MTEEQEGGGMTSKVFATRADYMPTPAQIRGQNEIRQLNLAHKSPHIVALLFLMSYLSSMPLLLSAQVFVNKM